MQLSQAEVGLILTWEGQEPVKVAAIQCLVSTALAQPGSTFAPGDA
jgi:hypothetical protein